jgi:hypothetical protein
MMLDAETTEGLGVAFSGSWWAPKLSSGVATIYPLEGSVNQFPTSIIKSAGEPLSGAISWELFGTVEVIESAGRCVEMGHRARY